MAKKSNAVAKPVNFKKTTVTKEQVEKARDVVKLSELPLLATKKAFSSGNTGWYAGGKTHVDGMKCQVSVSITIIGSKDAL